MEGDMRRAGAGDTRTGGREITKTNRKFYSILIYSILMFRTVGNLTAALVPSFRVHQAGTSF